MGKAENEVPKGLTRILAFMWMDSSLDLLTVLAGYRWMAIPFQSYQAVCLLLQPLSDVSS